jgi:hypothetical protein
MDFKLLLGVCVTALTLCAQTDYFPLQRGNQWTYRAQGPLGGHFNVEVTQQERIGNAEYFKVEGFPGGPYWLRHREDGRLVALVNGVEKIWAAFNESGWVAEVDPCTGPARVASRAANYVGGVGEYGNTLRVAYSNSGCADAGITEEWYQPVIGLVRRVESTIAGPRTWELVSVRLAWGLVLGSPEYSFGLTLDRSLYIANLMPVVDPVRAVPRMLARITLKHSQPGPVRVTFASGQTYEFVLKNERGEEVYRWSDGKAFTQALRNEAFDPGEKNWTVEVLLAAKDGRPLPQGRYLAEAWLVTAGGKQFAASLPFEIQHVF